MVEQGMKTGLRKIKLRLISDQKHNSQIVTGFLMLNDKYDIEIHNEIQRNPKHAYVIPNIVECEYLGKKIAYDTSDGYFDGIQDWVPKYDYYFKRSFSEERNTTLFAAEIRDRMFPLGFNYFVTCPGNPYGAVAKTWKSYAKMLMGRRENEYFTPEIFKYRDNYGQGVIFFTRLWKPEAYLTDEINAQREAINLMRIEILRKLKEEIGNVFFGGLYPGEFDMQMAPDLVVSKNLVRREKYLELMHSCNIAIGSTGLHESIGWKTGEYVAAGKAIVNEQFRYEVPGNFCVGKNYLPFSSADECVCNVKYLLEHPEETMRMQRRNREYYESYLAPDTMIERTLHIAEEKLAQL